MSFTYAALPFGSMGQLALVIMERTRSSTINPGHWILRPLLSNDSPHPSECVGVLLYRGKNNCKFMRIDLYPLQLFGPGRLYPHKFKCLLL